MIRVTAYPTVEWIRNRASDRSAIVHSSARLPLSGSFSDRLVSQLKPLLQETVAIEASVWIATPDGETEINIVLQKGRRKIAICVSARYDVANHQTDSLALVYGGFEALYRVQCDRTDRALNDLIYGLMCEKPSWFSNFGRLVVGRKASEAAILGSAFSQSHGSTLLDLDHIQLKRLKLSKANDWVAHFEMALNNPFGTQAA